MIRPIPIAAGIVILAFSQAWPGQNNERLEELAESVRQAIDQEKEPRPVQPGGYPHDGRMLLAQLRGAMSRDEAAQIEAALQGLSVYLDSEPLRRQCEEMSGQMRSEREARDRRTVEEGNAALNRAAKAVREAKKPSDLDSVLHELGQLGERRNEQQSSIALSNVLTKAQSTLRFVKHWQDYLANLAVGNRQAASQALDQLAGGYNMNEPDLIPRSEILARMHAVALPGRQNDEESPSDKNPAGEITVGKPLRYDKSTGMVSFSIKELDDLEGVINAFENLKNKPEFRNFKPPISGILETLLPLDRCYKELKAGLPANIPIPSRRLESAPLQNEIVAAGSKLILLALPRYLGLPPQTVSKPGEGPYDFLFRISTEAVARNDYLLASRAREAERLLREGTPRDPNEKSQAELFVTAHNQEVAGQYALAVYSYEKALASGTDLVPPKVIGERLAAIKAEHPQEFAQGFELYLAPPAPRYPSGYPYPPRWRPGMPMQQPTSAPAPVLPVPAPASTPTATPVKK